MAEPVSAALGALGRFTAELRWEDVPAPVRERVRLVLLDLLGVTLAGTATPEQRRLVAATDPPPGPATVLGARRGAVMDLAAWLNGVAACCLELDEGNKYARGHPAAHVVPAALAAAEHRHAPGPELLTAVLAGYEVAARFGAATRLRAGVHPHGNWGAAGAAAAVGRLWGLSPDRLAAALDAACGLVLATPFHSALTGNPVRNAWVGAANQAGLAAVRLAVADLAMASDTAAHTLGWLLGELDAGVLDAGLGTEWLITRGYFKRHASCSYTHPPADAALALRAGLDVDAVAGVTVETHHLAAGLNRVEVPTRLAAMFSIPYVVAVALRAGDCAPRRFDDVYRADPAVLALAARVRVVRDPAFDTRLPDERGARVTVVMADGEPVVAEVPNPIGDADYHPFGAVEVCAKLDGLGVDAGTVATAVDALVDAEDVTAVLPLLRGGAP